METLSTPAVLRWLRANVTNLHADLQEILKRHALDRRGRARQGTDLTSGLSDVALGLVPKLGPTDTAITIVAVTLVVAAWAPWRGPISRDEATLLSRAVMHDAESWDRVFDRVGREGLLLMLGGEVAVAIRDEFPRGSESREECETADLLEALATSEIWSLVYLGAIKRAMGLMFPAPAEDDARHLLAVARTPCDGADDDALAGFVAELEGRRDGPTLALFVAKSGHRDLFEHYARVAPRVVELYLASRHGFDDPTFSA